MQYRESQVAKLEGFELEYHLPEPVGNSNRFFQKRVALLVRVTTRSGVVGWGETWAYPGAASQLIKGMLAPIVIGSDVTQPVALHSRMTQLLGPDRRGQLHMAISAVDVAIWDAYGRTVGRPISDLLGGALRDEVMAYASGPFMKPGGDPYRDFPADIDSYVGQGFRAIKTRMGTKVDRDHAVAMQTRRAVGEDTLLMVDLNEGFTVSGAIEIAEAIAEARLAWLEEPLPHDDLPGYIALSHKLPMPLAGGESFCGAAAFRESLCARVFDLVQPDVAICGGITEAVRIGALAQAFSVPVVPHVWGGVINFLASLQYVATLPFARGGHVDFPLFEVETGINPLRSLFYDARPNARGMLAIPNGPGLGIEFDIARASDMIVDSWTLE